MGQVEVYNWLKNQYESGNMQWFTTQDVIKGLKQDNPETCAYYRNVRTQLIKLTVSKLIDMQDLDKTGFNNYNRVFRYKNGTQDIHPQA